MSDLIEPKCSIILCEPGLELRLTFPVTADRGKAVEIRALEPLGVQLFSQLL